MVTGAKPKQTEQTRHQARPDGRSRQTGSTDRAKTESKVKQQRGRAAGRQSSREIDWHAAQSRLAGLATWKVESGKSAVSSRQSAVGSRQSEAGSRKWTVGGKEEEVFVVTATSSSSFVVRRPSIEHAHDTKTERTEDCLTHSVTQSLSHSLSHSLSCSVVRSFVVSAATATPLPPSFTHCHSLLHSLSLTHSLSLSVRRSVSHSTESSLTHSLTHSLTVK